MEKISDEHESKSWKKGDQTMNSDNLKIIQILENMNKLIVYHVTTKRYLAPIKQNGLIPKIPEDYGESGDEIGIYCFPSMDDAEQAMMNWLGERIEEWEDENQQEYQECVLELDISGLQYTQDPDVGYEIIVKEPISPDRILKVLEI